jgi:hypothetical protein
VHALFADNEADNELTREDYVNQLTALLDPGGRADVYGFLNSICEALENNTYSTRAKFGLKLKEAFIAFRDDGEDVAEDEHAEDGTAEDGTAEATTAKLATIEGDNKVAGSKKERLYKAFENLRAKVAGADREFYGGDGVGYKFVLGLVSKHMLDAGECATDQHDVTNRILYELSQNIDKVRDIYKYLCSAAKKQGGEAFLDNLEDRKMHESIMVENEGEDGETYMEDNPAMHGDVRYKRGGKPSFQESIERRRALPDWIQGDDLRMCQLYREGHSYARIAEIMSTTLPAVKQRFASMRQTNEEMKAKAMGEVN